MNHLSHEHPLKIMLHPIFVHFPIAFYFLELVLIVLWITKEEEEYRRFSCLSFWFGYAFMLAAMAAGLFDAGGPAGIRGAVKRHFVAALTVFVIYTARAVFYWAMREKPEKRRFAKLTGAVLGNAAVAYAGFLGGLLVYD
ncbi:MAG: DUF2231 domain-containing protein [Candidatus Omnitrophica bacterium]|nr:DUF2231 domain-containing protein [Candidatus Omnitrophota bacterium]